MLKPIVLALLSMMVAGTTTALARDFPAPNHKQSWSRRENYLYSPGMAKTADDDWRSVVNDPHLPMWLRDACAGNHDQCNQWEDVAESHGIWRDHDKTDPLPAPEMDPADAMAGLAILACMLAIVRGRRPATNKT